VVHEEEKDWETGKVSLLHWELWLWTESKQYRMIQDV
jgi:hypothetical protein